MRLQAAQLLHEQVQLLKDTVTYGAGIDDLNCRTATLAKGGLEASWPSLRITNSEAECERITERKNDAVVERVALGGAVEADSQHRAASLDREQAGLSCGRRASHGLLCPVRNSYVL